jgi:thioredoxin
MSKKLIYLISFVLVLGVAVNASADLILHWPFDDGSGTTAADASGNGHNGTLEGDPKWVAGQIGGALEFGGGGERVVDEDAENYLNGLDAVTISIWIKSNETNSDRGFIIGEEPDRRDHLMTMRYDAEGVIGGGTNLLKMAVVFPNDEQQLESSNNLQTTEWQHVALVWSRNEQLKFYVNGELDTPLANDAPRDVSTSDVTMLIVGQGGKDVGRSWNGLVDDVRIYDEALTAERIQGVMVGEGYPYAMGPFPADGAIHEDIRVNLSWLAGNTAVSHDVYFGDNFDDVEADTGGTFLGNRTATYFAVGTPRSAYPDGLVPNTTYYWRIDEVEANGTTIHKGDVWSFTTMDAGGGGQEIENILANGGFEDGNAWLWSTYGSVTPEVVGTLDGAAVFEDPIEGGYALHLVIPEAGANFWDTGLQHAGHVFEVGKKYTLSAFLKSKKGTLDINFKPELGQDPWTGYGNQSFTMTEEWTEFSITTPVFTETVNPATITFHIGFAAGDFWIDGVRFYEGDYVPPDLGKPELASSPNPTDGATYVGTNVELSWSPGDTAVSHDVYFGDNFDDVEAGTGGTFLGNQTATYFAVGSPGHPYPDGLVPGTTYYWRVGEVEADGITIYKGDIWSFAIPPRTAYEPEPADGAEYAYPNMELSWSSGLGSQLHIVYFGDNFDDVNKDPGGILQETTTYTTGPLEWDKIYYWRVDEFDGAVIHKGHVWNFRTIPEIDPTLIGWWRFDEKSGIIAYDSSGNGNDGIIYGSPNWVHGIGGNALEFDGDDYVDYGALDVFDFGTGDFTITAWMKMTAPQKGSIFAIGGDDGGGIRYTLAMGEGNNNKLTLTMDNDSDKKQSMGDTVINDGLWHHVVGMRSGNVALVYVDGVQDGTIDLPEGYDLSGVTQHTALTGAITSNTSGRLIKFMVGLIDDVRIYNHALSEVEIQIAMKGAGEAWPYASSPNPEDGATHADTRANLSWTPGGYAVSHDVYFGDNFDDVEAGTGGTYKGSVADAIYTPGPLELGKTYYWRIVEFDGSTTHNGDVWSFTVSTKTEPTVEDFETNDFSTFPWENQGDASWTVTSYEKNSGDYSSQSGTIDHDESTTLRVRLDCISGDITFYRKVSSEGSRDYLKFYIDGVEKGKWSGTRDWDQVSFSVTTGTRTFEWTYSKDGSVSSDSDTAWIDDIVFPIGSDTIPTGVIELTDATFDQTIRNSDVTVLVDFWAPWCGPCWTMAPIIQEIADEYAGKAKICKLNVDDSPETTTDYGIRFIPTFILFKDGQEIRRWIGVTNKNEITAAIDALL